MNTTAILLLISGAALALVCIPLIRGKVPPNAVYGIRIKASYSSTEQWYRVNKFGGKLLLGVAMVILLLGLIGILIPLDFFGLYSIVCSVLILVSLLGAAAIIVLSFK